MVGPTRRGAPAPVSVPRARSSRRTKFYGKALYVIKAIPFRVSIHFRNVLRTVAAEIDRPSVHPPAAADRDVPGSPAARAPTFPRRAECLVFLPGKDQREAPTMHHATS